MKLDNPLLEALAAAPRQLADGAIRRPGRTLALMLALTLAAAPGLLRLELRTDGRALVPPGDPAVTTDAAVRARFGLEDPLVVVLETSHPDGIYNPTTLAIVRDLDTKLGQLPGLGPELLTSLATEHRDRVYPGTLDFRPFLDPFPDTPELLATLRGDVAATGILYGTLVSQDERATTLLVGVPEEVAGRFDRDHLYQQVVEAVAPFQSATDRLTVVGAPAAEALLGSHILADLTLLLPLAIGLIALVLWRVSRRSGFLMLAFGEVGASLVFTFGVMGWAGVPMYLTTAVLPVILTCTAIADEIHLFWRFQQLLGPLAGSPHLAAVQQTFREMARPVTLTAATTAAGFLSFAVSTIPGLRWFGVFAALGMVFSWLWSMTVTPALLTRMNPEWFRRAGAGAPGEGDGANPAQRGPWARWAAHPGRNLAVLGGLTLVLTLGAFRLAVQDSWIDGFARESPFRVATNRANELLFGTHELRVALTFEPPPPPASNGEIDEFTWHPPRTGPLLDRALLTRIGEFEAQMRQRPEVGGVLGTHGHLTAVSYLWLGRRPEARALPRDAMGIERLITRFEEGRGIERRREVISDDLASTTVTLFLKDANYRDTARLMAAIEDFWRPEWAKWPGRIEYAGDVAVSQAMIPAIVKNQVVSVVLAPFTCFALITLLFRSARAAALAVLPAAVAVAWVFGLMGWLGIPLGVATSMFCAITLGVGVDYGIHLLERNEAHRAAGSSEPVFTALGEAGAAITADALAISAGFALLAFSQVPANARLGLLVAVALLAACALTLAGLGALLRRRELAAGPGAPTGP